MLIDRDEAKKAMLKQQAIDLRDPALIGISFDGDLAVEILDRLPSAEPNLEKPDRSCKTCHYVDEFLGEVFLCRRLKESERVQPDFCCKKWRGEQDGQSNQQTGGN